MGKRPVLIIKTPFSCLTAVFVFSRITDIPVGIIDCVTSLFLAVNIKGLRLYRAVRKKGIPQAVAVVGMDITVYIHVLIFVIMGFMRQFGSGVSQTVHHIIGYYSRRIILIFVHHHLCIKGIRKIHRREHMQTVYEGLLSSMGLFFLVVIRKCKESQRRGQQSKSNTKQHDLSSTQQPAIRLSTRHLFFLFHSALLFFLLE